MQSKNKKSLAEKLDPEKAAKEEKEARKIAKVKNCKVSKTSKAAANVVFLLQGKTLTQMQF